MLKVLVNFITKYLLMKFLQTKPQVRNMNINSYDLYYTVIKNRDEKEIVNDKKEKDFNNFKDIIPNSFIGRKNNIETLKVGKNEISDKPFQTIVTI